MSNYDWAVNKQKLQRAIAISKNGPEEQVREEYVRIGGLISPSWKKKEEVREAPSELVGTNESKVPVRRAPRRKKAM